MKRRSKKRSPALVRLQEQFRLEVVFGGGECGEPLPCWFADHDGRLCGGPIESCHFINRQRIKNSLYAHGLSPEEIELAEWDPRLAVPGCTQHHRPFDSHATPPLVIFREQVPELLDAAVRDWGLEGDLARRCPSIFAHSGACFGNSHRQRQGRVDGDQAHRPR